MTRSPYHGLGAHHFWRRCVSGIERFRMDPVVSARFVIQSGQRVATAGSCFAQHISNRLSLGGFNYFVVESGEHLPIEQRLALNYGVFSGRFGNIYTARQLLQLYEACFDGRRAVDDVWRTDDGRYVDALRPRIAPGGYASEEEVRDERDSHLVQIKRMFLECDLFIFTLGLTEAWRSRSDGTVYPLAPGVTGGEYNAEKHEFVNLDIHDVITDMDVFLSRLKTVNPSVKVIFTVSPVPLVATYENRHVLVSTTYSKSVLRVAADMAYRKYDWVEYFPSYEIITGNYSNSVYYEPDYRGINSLGVDHAMRCFLRNFTAGNAHPAAAAIASYSANSEDVVCDEEAIDQVKV